MPAKKRSFPLRNVYGLLEPGPVVLVSTARDGRPNVMAMSWQTMIDFEPPIFGCVISNRNYTFDTLTATGQCGINIPTADMAAKVVACGNCSGRKVDKFAKLGLTPMPASQIEAPLVAECYANLECKVIDTTLADKYCFFILEVLKAWIDPARKRPRTIHHLGKGVFAVDGRTIKLPSKMK
ncbi:MAG: flavin reductase family protein [Planctomycetaceae bacterium]|nr:flavin reductase family protein [Planctomycetaceae bacterium]